MPPNISSVYGCSGFSLTSFAGTTFIAMPFFHTHQDRRRMTRKSHSRMHVCPNAAGSSKMAIGRFNSADNKPKETAFNTRVGSCRVDKTSISDSRGSAALISCYGLYHYPIKRTRNRLPTVWIGSAGEVGLCGLVAAKRPSPPVCSTTPKRSTIFDAARAKMPYVQVSLPPRRRCGNGFVVGFSLNPNLAQNKTLPPQGYNPTCRYAMSLRPPRKYATGFRNALAMGFCAACSAPELNMPMDVTLACLLAYCRLVRSTSPP
jgi:hypothetical protein